MEEEDDDEQLKLLSMKDLFVCPSFSSYSADRFADIAAKVGEELRTEGEEIDEEDDDDFEFSFVRCCDDDHDFGGGDNEFGEVFPIFNRDLLINVNQGGEVSSDALSIKIPLKKLFLEDREGDPSSSSSSSEVDELEAIPSETYCVWKPKAIEASPSTCNKSRSTGSGSKRWKLRDLLGRSNSDGKNAFVFLTPKRDQKQKSSEKMEILEERRNSKNKEKAKVKRVLLSSPSPAPEMQQPVYLRKRGGMKEGDKRKSYLPYRKDLVGFFTSVNGIGRSFPPF
ncbi:uncharacterized protein LOC124916166 [Impatiens glandulifera]|uniref:uncharacterized protein LOC124916166 n=1 Tax=Impatiens glandulifera TaxID=253017 RepID=UPI001FB085D9|nr:uncharacterized protein LOC124916166 [Impatiens glandulifera]